MAALADSDGQERRNAELLKLRGEVTRLRTDSQALAPLRASSSTDSIESTVSVLLKHVDQLKQRLEQAPRAKIPELQFLTDFDWLELVNTKLETEADYRKALGEIRKRAEGYFTKKFQSALGQYMGANNGQWPADLGQLKPFFNPSIDDTILERWQIVPKSTLPGREFASDSVLTEKAPVDVEFDHRWTIDGPGSGGVGPYQYQPSALETELKTLKTALQPVLDAYSASNGGKEPFNPYQLQPYLTTPSQQAAWQRIVEIVATNGMSGH